NEELEAANEELVAANEKLRACKEEFRSLNEELSTKNARLQREIALLVHANEELEILLCGADAIVLLDVALCIRRFTPAATRFFRLTASDVGRPLAHVAPRFVDAELFEHAEAVLETLTPIDRAVRTHEGQRCLRSVRPSRSRDGRIDGVIIAFVRCGEP